MGSVFLALDLGLERMVALKLLHATVRSGASQLRNEAKTLAAVNHPNIVTIYEIGSHEGREFIAMEYLSGRSLRAHLDDDRPTRDALLGILATVAGALAAAHRAGILHRDIKPDNVVVA